MAIDDAGDDGAEIGVRIDAVQLAGLDERGDDGPVPSAAVGTGEERIFARQRQWTDRAFNGVVVDLDRSVTGKPAKSLPS